MSYFSSALSFSHFLLDQYTTCSIIIHPKNRNDVPGRVPLQQEPSFFSPSWHYFFKEQTELTESQISSFILLPIHSNLAFFTTHSIVIIKAMIYFCLFFFYTTFYNLVGLERQCSVLETAEEIAELRFFSTKKVLLTKHAKRSLKESDFRNHPCRYFLSDMFDHSKYLFLCFNMAHSLFLTFSY